MSLGHLDQMERAYGEAPVPVAAPAPLSNEEISARNLVNPQAVDHGPFDAPFHSAPQREEALEHCERAQELLRRMR